MSHWCTAKKTKLAKIQHCHRYARLLESCLPKRRTSPAFNGCPMPEGVFFFFFCGTRCPVIKLCAFFSMYVQSWGKSHSTLAFSPLGFIGLSCRIRYSAVLAPGHPRTGRCCSASVSTSKCTDCGAHYRFSWDGVLKFGV